MKRSFWHQARPALVRFGPPLAVWCVSWLLVAFAFQRQGQPLFAAESYTRADSGHYLSIARNGYRLYPCEEPYEGVSESWCGTVGWFPLYPYLMRIGPLVGVSLESWGCLLAQVFRLAFLLVVWSMLRHDERFGRNVWLLVFVGVFPGGIYYHAMFPVSLFVLLQCLAMERALANKVVPCAFFAGLAAMSYSTGFVLSAPLAIWMLMDRERSWSRRLWRLTIPVVGTWVGFALVLALMYWTVGRWNAFFIVQAKYGHGLHWPFVTYFSYWNLVARGPAGNPIYWPMVQTVAVGVLLVATGVGYWVLRGWRDRIATLGLLVAGAYWLFPLIVGMAVSLDRAEALLVPIVLVLRRFPTWVAALLSLAALPMFVKLAALFAARVLM